MNITERHMENKSVMMKHRWRENRVEEEDEQLKEVKMRILWGRMWATGLEINQTNRGGRIKETKLSGIMKRIKEKQRERMGKGNESETARTKHLSLCVC